MILQGASKTTLKGFEGNVLPDSSNSSRLPSASSTPAAPPAILAPSVEGRLAGATLQERVILGCPFATAEAAAPAAALATATVATAAAKGTRSLVLNQALASGSSHNCSSWEASHRTQLQHPGQGTISYADVPSDPHLLLYEIYDHTRPTNRNATTRPIARHEADQP